MSLERRPNPFKLELEPAAEEYLQEYIDAFKNKAIEIVTHYKYATDRVKQTVIASLELLEPSAIMDSIVENRHDTYRGVTLEEQFRIWMKINFINRELGDLRHDAFEDKERVSEGTSISLIADELEALIPRRKT